MEGGSPPIVTIPRDLFFSDTFCDDIVVEDSSSPGYPVYLTEDWDSGIGGGLWTTGLALGRYFATSSHFLEEFRLLRARKQEKHRNETSVRVLELGSGNGFLGVCLVTAVAVAEANETNRKANWPGIEVVVTDTAEHLSLMRATIESNLNRILPQIQQCANKRKSHTKDNCPPLSEEIMIEKIARAEEYLWGEDYDFGEKKGEPFDLIIGSDVAYRDYLHDPLIAALDEFCEPQHTVALIGVTMNDTKPIFFEKLQQRGFRFEKLADHLLGDEFGTSSRQFGVFAISKR